MGACCGGMKTSHQHKSLPEKNKAAAAANEQQLNNDAVAAKTASSGVEGEESHAVVNDGDEQQEVATKTTSLEACPSGPLKQNGSPLEALHGNHVDAEQQQPDLLQVEEPDLLVAVKAASVSAEAPAAGVEEPEVTVIEEPVLVVATNAELVACEPPSSGDDAGNEEIGVDTIQLRISEDGDLEKSSAAETSPVQLDDHVVVQESHRSTEIATSVEEAAPVEVEVTPEKSDTIDIPITQEEKLDVELADVVDEQIRQTVEEVVEAAVPYQPEVVRIEKATTVETSPELPAELTVNIVTEDSTDKVPQESSLEEEIPAVQSEIVLEQPAASVEEPSSSSAVTVDADLPPVVIQSASEEVDVTADVLLESSPAISEVSQNDDVVVAATSVSEPEVTLVSSVPEVPTVSESVEAASSDIPIVTLVEEEQPVALVAEDSAVHVPSEQEPQPQLPTAVDSEPPTKEEENPVETAAPNEAAESVEVTSPVQAEEPVESATPVTVDSVAVTAAPEGAVDEVIDPVIDENQQQSPVEEAVHTEAVPETAPEVPASETTLQSVPVFAEGQVTELVNEGETDQRLAEPVTPEQPETLVEEIPAQVDVTSDENAPSETSVDQVEVPLPDAETATHESAESNTQVSNVQPEESGTLEATTTVDQTPVSSDDTTTDQSLPPPPPADPEVVPETVETEQQPPVAIDGDDALPPPPPPEDLSIEQQATAAADEQQEPALPTVADEGKEATALADSGVSLTVSSPDDSTVSPTSEESSSSAADNVSPSELGEISSSTTLPSSQETPILSEA